MSSTNSSERTSSSCESQLTFLRQPTDQLQAILKAELVKLVVRVRLAEVGEEQVSLNCDGRHLSVCCEGRALRGREKTVLRTKARVIRFDQRSS